MNRLEVRNKIYMDEKKEIKKRDLRRFNFGGKIREAELVVMFL